MSLSSLSLAPFRRKKAGAAYSRDERIMVGLLLLLVGFLFFTIVVPLGFLFVRSVQNADGAFVGLANFQRFFSESDMAAATMNSIFVSTVSTVITIVLAFLFAYMLTRTLVPLKSAFRAMAMVPLLAPSLLPAIALIYLFGQQGVARGLLFGHTIYGPIGIIIAEVMFAFPQAVLILVTALMTADQRLYEAALSLRAGPVRTFFTVTLPSCRYGLISASLSVCVKVFTDFGAPAVIGGSYPVLATEIFKQVVGLFDFNMGAVVGICLLLPAVLSFLIERILQRRQVSMVSAQSVPLIIRPQRSRDGIFLAYGLTIAAAMLTIIGMAVLGSVIRYWPYNLTLTLEHYDFRAVDNTGWDVYVNSLLLSFYTGTFGTILVFAGAYLTETLRRARWLGDAVHLMSVTSLAIPGLVLGISYIFFFNSPSNPLNVIYGTMTILVVSTIVHFYTVPHLIALTALKQLDKDLNVVADSLRVPFHKMLRRVVVPVCLPSIVDIWGYFFVNAMTTVSAVIFLFSAQIQLGAVTIVRWNDAGKIAPAAAMSVSIFATAAAVMILKSVVVALLLRKTQRWRVR